MFKVVIIVIFVVWLLRKMLINLYKAKIERKDVVITGGSSGLGLELAKQLAARDCNITIIARNKDKLSNAIKIIKKHCVSKNNQKIRSVSLDVTNQDECLDLIRKNIISVDYLFCCAGHAETGFFLTQNIQNFKNSMNLNYFGSLHVIKAFLPSLLKKRSPSHLVFIGSTLSLFSLPGYSDYTPSKWALRAFCDTLRLELLSTSVRAHIYFPSSIKTVSLQLENQRKPRVAKKIEGEEAVSAEECALKLLEGVEEGRYYICHDLFTWICRVALNGSSPRGSERYLISLTSWFLEWFATPFVYLACFFVYVYCEAVIWYYKKDFPE